MNNDKIINVWDIEDGVLFETEDKNILNLIYQDTIFEINSLESKKTIRLGIIIALYFFYLQIIIPILQLIQNIEIDDIIIGILILIIVPLLYLYRIFGYINKSIDKDIFLLYCKLDLIKKKFEGYTLRYNCTPKTSTGTIEGIQLSYNLLNEKGIKEWSKKYKDYLIGVVVIIVLYVTYKIIKYVLISLFI